MDTCRYIYIYIYKLIMIIILHDWELLENQQYGLKSDWHYLQASADMIGICR